MLISGIFSYRIFGGFTNSFVRGIYKYFDRNTLYSEMDMRVNAATNGRSILFLNTPIQYMVEGSSAVMAPYWMNANNPTLSQKISDNMDDVAGLIGDRQFYFISGAVTGDDGNYPHSEPKCKRCSDGMWQTLGFQDEASCQLGYCNYSLTDKAVAK